MLKIEVMAGHEISRACKEAVAIARHPLAQKAEVGAWYAFKVEEGQAVCITGPWTRPETDAEETERHSFFEHCMALPDRRFIQVQVGNGGHGVCFDFNGVHVVQSAVSPDDPRTTGDLASALVDQWQAGMDANHAAYWTPERRAQAARERTAYQEKMARLKRAAQAAQAKFPFVPNNEETYAEYKALNGEGYNQAVVTYAENWAALMEEKMANGSSLEDAAQATRLDADYEGITGFQWGAAVQQLGHWWKHGPALLAWAKSAY